VSGRSLSHPLPTWLDHLQNWERAKVMKILIIKLSPSTCYILPFRFKYSAKHRLWYYGPWGEAITSINHLQCKWAMYDDDIAETQLWHY
jgi:hypothetical protein